MVASIYALGSNSSGQLGIGHKEDVSVPKEVIFNNDIATPEPLSIRAGGNHTLLLSSSGQLFVSGDYENAACGLVPENLTIPPIFRPARLAKENPSTSTTGKITHCAATWEASIIARSDQQGQSTQVYTFGTGNKGELGLGDFIFRSPTAQLITDFPPEGTQIVDLAACMGHAVAVLDSGEVYGWGNGRKGQLGEPQQIVFKPRKFSGLKFKVTRAVCGREFSYLLGVQGGNESIFLGEDKWDIISSSQIDIKGWRDVGASWGNIFLLLESGKLLSWGRNDHGQLAPSELPKVTKIAVGSEHVLALSDEGNVMAWGWGEHGNCGPQTSNGDVKGRWNIIASSQYLPADTEILSIGSGCATSWIYIGTV
jgi:protein ATS1